jgi:hypothetical protein
VVLDLALDTTVEVPDEVPDRTRAEVPVDPDILAVPVGAQVEAPVDLSVAGLGEMLAETIRWDVRSRCGPFDEEHHPPKGQGQVLGAQQRPLEGQVEMVGVGVQIAAERRHSRGSTRFEGRQFLLSTPHTIDPGKRRGKVQKLRQIGRE